MMPQFVQDAINKTLNEAGTAINAADVTQLATAATKANSAASRNTLREYANQRIAAGYAFVAGQRAGMEQMRPKHVSQVRSLV